MRVLAVVLGSLLACAPSPDAPGEGATALAAPACAVGQGVFHGCYFDNPDFTAPVAERDDPRIDFDWGAGAPAPGMGRDTFSVLWQGDFTFAGGTWQFTATADDGLRVYVDDVPIVDAWRNQSATTYVATRTLTAGTHRVRFEYYENGWDAVARLSWAGQSAPPPAGCTTVGQGVFHGCYFDDPDFTALVAERDDPRIDFGWGSGAPAPGVGADTFSVRWQGDFTFAAGDWRFTATADDGVRVWVDGALVIDAWRNQSATTYAATRTLAAGTHRIRTDYFENGWDAVARLSWTGQAAACGDGACGGGESCSTCAADCGACAPPPAPPPAGCTTVGQGVFRGCYFDNPDFTALVVERDDPRIDFDWGAGAPAPGVGPDTFSVRWQGDFAFAGGAYDFAAVADDGVRLYVDDALVVDAWRDQSATAYHATRTLAAGAHRVRLEYYERGWDAVARLSWTPAGTCRADADCGAASWCEGGRCAPMWAGLHGLPVSAARPQHLLFIGNSLTSGGPIPDLVAALAESGGWPAPIVRTRAVDGQDLRFHRGDATTLALVDQGGWDFVVLQDFSTRPTDATAAGGDVAGFHADAVWLYDRVKQASPAARVLLFETWARGAGHPYYPTHYADPGDMQAQLRLHTNEASERVIPARSIAAAPGDVWVAPVGDAWERHLGAPSPLRLHDLDDHHAGPRGQYLTAAVIYAAVYGCRSAGLATLLGLDAVEAARLQADADATTGAPACPR